MKEEFVLITAADRCLQPPHTVLGHAELVAVDEKKDVELTAVVVHTPSANSQNLLKPSESGSVGSPFFKPLSSVCV